MAGSERIKESGSEGQRLREATAELARNEAYARQLGFTGTPSWIAGNAAFEGAVGFAELNAAVNNEAS